MVSAKILLVALCASLTSAQTLNVASGTTPTETATGAPAAASSDLSSLVSSIAESLSSEVASATPTTNGSTSLSTTASSSATPSPGAATRQDAQYAAILGLGGAAVLGLL